MFTAIVLFWYRVGYYVDFDYKRFVLLFALWADIWLFFSIWNLIINQKRWNKYKKR